MSQESWDIFVTRSWPRWEMLGRRGHGPWRHSWIHTDTQGVIGRRQIHVARGRKQPISDKVLALQDFGPRIHLEVEAPYTVQMVDFLCQLLSLLSLIFVGMHRNVGIIRPCWHEAACLIMHDRVRTFRSTAARPDEEGSSWRGAFP